MAIHALICKFPQLIDLLYQPSEDDRWYDHKPEQGNDKTEPDHLGPGQLLFR